MTERYRSRTPEQSGPARQGFAITPSDASALASEIRALYVGAAGDLALVLASGDSVTLSAVPAGSLLPLRVQKVKATGTTAAALVGLY